MMDGGRFGESPERERHRKTPRSSRSFPTWHRAFRVARRDSPMLPPNTMSHGVLMPRPVTSLVLLATLVTGAAGSIGLAQEGAPPTAEQVRFFEAKVRPTLVEHCAKCHGATKPKAGLRLDSRA